VEVAGGMDADLVTPAGGEMHVHPGAAIVSGEDGKMAAGGLSLDGGVDGDFLPGRLACEYGGVGLGDTVLLHPAGEGGHGCGCVRQQHEA
jgi:hypothetical protein